MADERHDAPSVRRTRKKRRTPLQGLLCSVEVKSLANGAFVVEAKWQPMYAPVGGVITRMYAARHLARFLNAHLKGSK